MGSTQSTWGLRLSHARVRTYPGFVSDSNWSSMRVFVALLPLMALVASQAPSPCPGPKTFEGRFNHMDRERQMFVQGKIAFDEPNMRYAEFEDYHLGRNETFYFKLKLYKENKEDRLDLKTRNCTVTPPYPRFHPWGVIPGAKLERQEVIGATGVVGESVSVAAFSQSFGNDSYIMVVSEPSCFPIHYADMSADRPLDVRDFYDCQEGIRSPEMFDIPKECAGL